jgi:hypothetical protein
VEENEFLFVLNVFAAWKRVASDHQRHSMKRQRVRCSGLRLAKHEKVLYLDDSSAGLRGRPVLDAENDCSCIFCLAEDVCT